MQKWHYLKSTNSQNQIEFVFRENKVDLLYKLQLSWEIYQHYGHLLSNLEVGEFTEHIRVIVQKYLEKQCTCMVYEIDALETISYSYKTVRNR